MGRIFLKDHNSGAVTDETRTCQSFLANEKYPQYLDYCMQKYCDAKLFSSKKDVLIYITKDFCFLPKITSMDKEVENEKEENIIIPSHKSPAATTNSIVVAAPKTMTPTAVTKIVGNENSHTVLFTERNLTGKDKEDLSPNKRKLLSL